MAGFMKSAMNALGIGDTAYDEQYDYDDDTADDATEESFDAAEDVMPQPTADSDPAPSDNRTSVTPFRSQMNKLMTITPKSFNDAQVIGRAVRSGIPVILNLSEAPDAEAFRIIDFSSGVVFGVQGSIERVTSRVYVLSPAQVNLCKPEGRQDNSDQLFH